MWENMLFMVTSDNGGDCGLPAQTNPKVGGAPGYASNYPLLGRKCTAWDGGTRTAAFVAGGLVPARLRGSVNDALFYITDW
jgi:arylsulfatase I/J